MEYLRRSLGSIEIKLEEPLVESAFIAWQKEKRENSKPDDDKVDYREAYFNQKICVERGCLLLDRVLTDIKSLEQKDVAIKWKLPISTKMEKLYR